PALLAAAPAPSGQSPGNGVAAPAPPPVIAQAKPSRPPVNAEGETGASAPATMPPPVNPPPEAVQVQSLAVPEGQLVGLIDSGSRARGRDLCSGSDRAVIEPLAARPPAPQGSPAMPALARKVLLSRADPPQGQPGRVSLNSARLDRALEIGQLAAVEPLA